MQFSGYDAHTLCNFNLERKGIKPAVSYNALIVVSLRNNLRLSVYIYVYPQRLTIFGCCLLRNLYAGYRYAVYYVSL